MQRLVCFNIIKHASMISTASCWRSSARYKNLIQLVYLYCKASHNVSHGPPTLPTTRAFATTAATSTTASATITTNSTPPKQSRSIKKTPAPYKSITYRHRNRKWQAQVGLPCPITNGKTRMWHLGLYTNAEDAAVVIDLAYWLLGRPVPNFPSTAYSMHPLVQEIGDVQNLTPEDRVRALRQCLRLRDNNKGHTNSTKYAYLRKRISRDGTRQYFIMDIRHEDRRSTVTLPPNVSEETAAQIHGWFRKLLKFPDLPPTHSTTSVNNGGDGGDEDQKFQKIQKFQNEENEDAVVRNIGGLGTDETKPWVPPPVLQAAAEREYESEREYLLGLMAAFRFWAKEALPYSSKLTGVFWHKRVRVWVANIHVGPQQIIFAHCHTEEDAYRLRCIGLLLIAPTVKYTRHHLVQEALQEFGDDPLYLQLKEELGVVTLESVVARLRVEGERLLEQQAVVPPVGEELEEEE